MISRPQEGPGHGRFEQRLDRGAEGAKWKRPGMVLEVGNRVEESDEGDNELPPAGRRPEHEGELGRRGGHGSGKIPLPGQAAALLRLSDGTRSPKQHAHSCTAHRLCLDTKSLRKVKLKNTIELFVCM